MALFTKNGTYGNFTSAVLVDWNDLDRVSKLQKGMKKAYRKRIGAKNMKNNRINTFAISSVSFQKDISLEKRKELEKDLQEKFSKYSQDLLKLYREEIKVNEDESSFIEVFKHFRLDKLSTDMQMMKKVSMEKVEQKIEHLISSAFVGIWDLHHNESSKIILNDKVLKIPNGDLNKDVEVSSIIDELIITNFGLDFLPFSYKMIDLMHCLFVELDEFVKVTMTDKDISLQLLPLLRNFIGAISGMQENLKLFRRQLIRVNEILESTVEELNTITSEDLEEWLARDIKQLQDSTDSIESLDHMEQSLVQLKDNLRSILKKGEKSDISENSIEIGYLMEFFKRVIEIKSEISALTLWINRFEDIPSFTSMDDGIAYEKVEKESYLPKSEDALLETTKIFKMYTRGTSTVYVLRGVEMTIDKGDFVVIHGPSGSGKTTLLNLLSGLDDADRGAVFFNGKNLLEMKDREKTRLRRDNYSFIFQSYALIPHLTAFENVKLPLDLSGFSKELADGINDLLSDVGIGEYASHRPALLSGGQMQRLGIARALIARPQVIFADEPTGDLDEVTGLKIMKLLKKYHEETGVTVVLVTHNKEFIKFGNKEILVKDGQIVK